MRIPFFLVHAPLYAFAFCRKVWPPMLLLFYGINPVASLLPPYLPNPPKKPTTHSFPPCYRTTPPPLPPPLRRHEQDRGGGGISSGLQGQHERTRPFLGGLPTLHTPPSPTPPPPPPLPHVPC